MTDQHTGPGAEEVEDPLGPPAGSDLSEADAGAGAPTEGRPAEGAAGAGGGTGSPPDLSTSSVEELIATLEQTTVARDEYLDALRRNQADFENYRKRVAKQAADDAARAAETLVDRLLPVLDACDGALHHGATEVEPIFAALLGTLEKEGLERVSPAGAPFDPNRHEAVMHEQAEEGDEGTVVTDVMRPGYVWKGRVIRPAMVKVRG